MKLIDACMRGLVLIRPQQQTLFPDFVLNGNGRCLVVLRDWWKAGYTDTDSLLFISGQCTFDGKHWNLPDLENGAFLSDAQEDFGKEAARMRYDMYLNRSAYLTQLDYLAESLGQGSEFSFDEWGGAVYHYTMTDTVRAQADTVLEKKKMLRKICRLSLLNPDNVVIDVLALAEGGEAATLNGNPMLERFASLWELSEDESDVERYAKFIVEHTPRDLTTFGAIDCFVSTEDVDVLCKGE